MGYSKVWVLGAIGYWSFDSTSTVLAENLNHGKVALSKAQFVFVVESRSINGRMRQQNTLLHIIRSGLHIVLAFVFPQTSLVQTKILSIFSVFI
jgi:hypothetical protein